MLAFPSQEAVSLSLAEPQHKSTRVRPQTGSCKPSLQASPLPLSRGSPSEPRIMTPPSPAPGTPEGTTILPCHTHLFALAWATPQGRPWKICVAMQQSRKWKHFSGREHVHSAFQSWILVSSLVLIDSLEQKHLIQ